MRYGTARSKDVLGNASFVLHRKRTTPADKGWLTVEELHLTERAAKMLGCGGVL